uniref:Uncharacterized protein n=1 Tax=viral metagenome TaxID=1070528 RepID=A0A6C0DTX3_9ZZZZ
MAAYHRVKHSKSIPLFLTTHYSQVNNVLYLAGDILEGPFRGKYFGVEYNEISKEEFVNSINDESKISFNYKDKYYCLNVGINTEDRHFSEIIENHLIQVKDNSKNGEFVYSNYMNPVAYIIMSGMIYTRI